METVASNPGQISIHWPTFIRYRVPWFAAYVLFFLFGVGALVRFQFRSNGICIFTVVVVCGVYWLMTCLRHWKRGDVNPGVVISARPFLAAVLADMSQGGGWAPAIKIIAGSAPPEGARIGDRFATVALYAGAAGRSDTWRDLDPKPAYTATSDPEALKRVFKSIPAWQWRALEDGIRQVPEPKKWKLYRIQLDPERYMNPTNDTAEEPLRVTGFEEEDGKGMPQGADGKISFSCSGCGKQYTVPQEYAARTVRCKKCNTHNTIPESA